MTTKTQLIQAESLHFSYAGIAETVQIMDGFGCQLGAAGEFSSIMGPSGSGKSTFLHLCGGLLKPHAGNLTVLGERLSAMDETQRAIFRRLKIGFVFQFFHLLPTLNALENVMVAHWMDKKRSRAEDETWARQLLEQLGVGHRWNHYPFEMSGGEVQRTALARALFNRPQLIIADEPVGNLDRKSRRAVLQLLKDVTRQFGTCVIMATHDDDSIHFVDRAYRIDPKGLTALPLPSSAAASLQPN